MTVFANARIFDGISRALLERQSVFVRGERIAEVSNRPPTAGDGTVIDCGGRTLMPGLIDAHVHVYAHSVNVYDIATAPETLSACWATHALGRMLDRGFTTVRDTGGTDYGLYLALRKGFIRGPRLYYCGRAISQTGGHGDFRNPHHHHSSDDHLVSCGCGVVGTLTAVVDGVDGVRRVVRDNLRRGSNFVKFMGSGGISSTGDELDSIQFSDEEVRAVIDEVERHGAYCTAHIHPDGALKRAIRLGVHCIEHGTLVEPDTARMAADKGTYIVPTMVIHYALALEGKTLGYPRESLAKLERVKHTQLEHLAHLRDAGVVVGYGSDLLGLTERHQLTEFTLRREVYSPYDLLVQATSANALIIGAKGELGVIAPGAYADLLVVDGDPLADIAVLAQDGASLAAIMQAGVFLKSVLN
jgi:imidazolonepropionase-like amidohydrolase